MRKVYFVIGCIFALLTISCSNNASSSSGSDGKGGSLAIFALKGDYLYTVDYQKLNIFSVLNKENPVKVNDIDVGFNIETIYSLENLLFIGSRDAMYIYDIVHPENPKLLSKSQHFRACDPVVANGTHAFVTLHSNANCGNNLNSLLIYDIDSLENPELIHQRNLTFPKGLAVDGKYLIVCDDELKIFDISNPSEPFLVLSKNALYKDVVIYNGVLFAFGESIISQFKWTGDNISSLEEISSIKY